MNDFENTTPQKEPIVGEGKLGLIELIYGAIASPVALFRKISGNVPLFYSFVIFIAVVLLSSVMNSLIPPDLSKVTPEYSEILSKARPFFGIIGALFGLMFWFIKAGVLQVFGELFGGRGRAMETLAVLALSGIPGVLSIPFQVISYFTAGAGIGNVLYILASIISLIWTLVLLVIGIREIQGISTFRAFATVFSPFLIMGLLLIILITGLVITLLPMANTLG